MKNKTSFLIACGDNMKKSWLLLIISFYGIAVQAQNFQWAQKVGGHWADYGNAMVSDNDGNVYITGTFQGTVDFDPGFGEVNLASAGNTDVFVAKFDAFGNLVWAKSMGGASIFGDIGRAIALDANRNIIVSGTFQGSADFDPGTSAYTLTSNGEEDVFIAKLDAGGNFLWAKGFGGSQADYVSAMVTDKFGNLLLTGSFSERQDFDLGTDTFFVTPKGNNCIFILKLGASGSFSWVKSFGEEYSQSVNALSVDANSNIYLAGDFYNIIDFNPGSGVDTMRSMSDDIFILKLDANGNFVWVKGLEGNDYGSGNDLAVDALGNVHLTGLFSGTFDFDPGPAKTLFTSNGQDVFILKLSPVGILVWAKHIGSNGADNANGIAVDKDGNVFTTGYFGNRVDFDPGTAVFNLQSAGSLDVFVSKLNSSGAFISAVRMGGKGVDVSGAISINAGGDIYTCGNFEGKSDFDPGAGNDTLEADGTDVFISKLSINKTGINLNNSSNGWSIYPNPAKDVLFVNQDLSKEIDFRIVDSYGRTLLNGELNKPETSIDIDTLPDGIYFIELGENHLETLKFVKVK